MINQLSRLLVLLRQEKKLSQKKAADALGISQALLSHYEKGIRECGLDFLLRVASFYNVSTDYLLGRTADRQGAVILAQELPDENAAGKENILKGSVLSTLNKRLIFNSLNILYDLLQKTNSKELITEISADIMLSIYRNLRYVYSINEQNPNSLFAAEKDAFSQLCSSTESLIELKIRCLTNNAASRTIKPIEADLEKLSLNQQEFERLYPLYATSLFNLIQTCETRMQVRGEKQDIKERN